MIFYYQQIVIYRLTKFLGNYIASYLVRRTKVSVSGIKQESLQMLTYSLTWHHFDLCVDIESPVVLIPIMKNGDPETPIWVFNIGNLKLVSKDEQNRDFKYLHVYLEVSSTRFEYHPSYSDYIKKISKNFNTLLTDFAIQAKISVGVAPKTEPKVIVDGEFSEANFQFEPATYKEFIKIGNVLKLESEIVKMLQTDKSMLIKHSNKIGTVFCFSEGLNQWKHQYIILAEAYLYLYDSNSQEFPSNYYYLPDAIVKEEGKNEVARLYTLSTSNKYGTCRIGCRTEKQKDEWKSLLCAHIKEISEVDNLEESLKNLPKAKALEPNTIIANISCRLPRLTLNFRNEKRENWIAAQLGQTKLKLFVRPHDFAVNAAIRTISLTNVKKREFANLIVINENADALSLEVLARSPLSPLYAVSFQFTVCRTSG